MPPPAHPTGWLRGRYRCSCQFAWILLAKSSLCTIVCVCARALVNPTADQLYQPGVFPHLSLSLSIYTRTLNDYFSHVTLM